MTINAARRIEASALTPIARTVVGPIPRKVLAPQAIESVMHPHVYRIALGFWIVFMSIFWLTFWISANALFMVVIGTFYAVVFFGVPYIMLRQVPGRTKAKGSLLTFLENPFATLNGSLRGYEALLQVILVPLCLAVGGAAIGIIIRSARALN